jgi:ABC-type sugar transport system ATPase subunit
MTVADRIAVLARGELVGIKEADAVTRDEVIAMMMGEQLTEQS